ncbi:MAG: hypothetical protein K8R77_01590 [Anaerolineaceae bacterium]|nr:hypothetical protein [Anaerolineaceae bacterium]
MQIKTSWLNRHFTFTTRENNQARKDAYIFSEALQESEIWFTIDEIQKIARTPVIRLIDERTRAACVFLLLSGMRIGAFLTLPLQAVDMDKLLIRQWTSLGVHTKLGKNATTTIVNLREYPQLIEVVRSWDAKVRAVSPSEGYWFPNIHPLTGELDPAAMKGKYRASGFGKDLHTFLATKVDMHYKSAHKFRHGHIRLLRDRVERFDDIEAIAHNCMQTVETMLRYARMSENSAQKRIHQMAQRERTNFSGERALTDVDPQTIRLVQDLLSSMLPNDSRRF